MPELCFNAGMICKNDQTISWSANLKILTFKQKGVSMYSCRCYSMLAGAFVKKKFIARP